MPPSNYPTPPRRRTGATPEAKVAAACRAYLKRIGALALRTGAGVVQVNDRTFSIGEVGRSDDTVLLPGGWWASVEYKTDQGRQSPAQQRFQARVEALGGLYILARSVADVRAALVQRFGETLVAQWEAKR